MKVITFSRQFPAYHLKAGQPTFFVEKITSLLSVISPGWSTNSRFDDLRKACLFNAGEYRSCQENEIYKSHTIRSGKRWRQGEWASLRVWSDKPYASKQIEFAKVQLPKVWDLEIELWNGFMSKKLYSTWYIDNQEACVLDVDLQHSEGLQKSNTIAKNDGLSLPDLLSWLKQPSEFSGQILCWNENINY